MKEFIEKLIGRLEGREKYYHECALDEIMTNGHTLDAEGFLGKEDAYGDAISIVNQLAEEYADNEVLSMVQMNNVFQKAKLEELKQIRADVMAGGWIPCSERLPEVNQKVIVTYKDRYIGGCDGVCDGMYIHSLDMWDISDYDCKDDFEVIAWQPFPESYRPENS